MHRDGSIWLGAADYLGRLLGIEMALTKRGSPASNRHQGDVDVRHPVKRKVRTCVPRIPAPARALDKIAECGSAMRAPRVSPAIVIGGQDAYPSGRQTPRGHRARPPRASAAAGDWLEQAARTCWGDKNRGGRDESERRQVGVVGV